MALPQNRPPYANLTPEEMRQGIRRLEQRMADAQASNEMDFFDAATRERQYNLAY
jgi:hypothetical protein